MEALNSVGLTILSVLSEKRTEPRRNVQLHRISQLKNFPTLANVSSHSAKLAPGAPKNISGGGGLALVNCLLGSGIARALTYEEALEQSVVGFSPSDFDVNGLIDTVTNFIVSNPLVAGVGVAVVTVPLLLSLVFGSSRPWGVESAKGAYGKLADDVNAQLLDIRPQGELRKVGTPDIRGLKKKAVNVAFGRDDKLGFLKKLSLKFKEPENTTLYILDKFDGNSELVAELVTSNGFKAAYAIKDGAEGSRGWLNSGLPWIRPTAFSLDFSSLTDAFSGSVGEGPGAVPLTLVIAAAAGLGLLAFTEVETILQVLGSAALVQFVSNKFLFAEDRNKTLKQVDEFLTTKVAPKDLVDDVKQIGKALLPPVTSKALPAPAGANSDLNNALSKTEAVSEPTPEVNSVPVAVAVAEAEAEAGSRPGISNSLSPYPNYPDLKPPTSPMPSQP